ncbi:MAG TPA: SWIM zinc finger family protein [Kofleriaceae bacterium]|jgi:uncharacterized Zn finger protein|nr:SWIM zinc finger family protein [Kofleriaceae bacterium]
MSRWSERGWYRPPPPRPSPPHGIKVQKTGATWWGQRWIEALAVVLRGDARRLARGRTYARAGRTHDLVVKGGEVTASVTGSRTIPYRVTIKVAQLPNSAWTKAIASMATQAQFAAELLAGQMPKQIAEVFRDAGTHLFPTQRADLATSCTCPDWGDPCKHVAATHYVLGEAFDRDPFLLFELRGRTKAQVLDALRLARTGGAGEPRARGRSTRAAAPPESAIPAIPKVTLGPLDPAAYERLRDALPAFQLSFHEPEAHGAVLLQLGAPAAWSSSGSPAELLAPIVRAAAERARRIAMAEPEIDPAADIAADAIAAPRAKRASKRRRSSIPAKTTTPKPTRRRAAVHRSPP